MNAMQMTHKSSDGSPLTCANHIYSGNFSYNGWLLVFISSNAIAFAKPIRALRLDYWVSLVMYFSIVSNTQSIT